MEVLVLKLLGHNPLVVVGLATRRLALPPTSGKGEPSTYYDKRADGAGAI